MRQYVYSKVSAKTNTSEQFISVNPDLKYWVVLRMKNQYDRLLVFTDLNGYTTTINMQPLETLKDYGTFELDSLFKD